MQRLIPFGERILVRRKQVGEKAGSIYLPDEVKERATDLATVVYLPENTFADEELMGNADKIIDAMLAESIKGHSDALIALLRLGEFCKLKSIKVGDEIFISKYVGVDFVETGSTEQLTLVNLSDVIGICVKE